MYVQYTSIKAFLPPDIQPVYGSWYACAISQHIIDNGMMHLNRSDYYCGLNALVEWGNYTSSKLVFWNLDLAVELLPGNAIFFLNRIIHHSSIDVQQEIRNLVNCFVHQNPLSWKDKKHKELTGYGHEGKLDKKTKKVKQGKEKEKEQKGMEQAKKRKHEDSNVDIKDVGKGKQKLVEVSGM